MIDYDLRGAMYSYVCCGGIKLGAGTNLYLKGRYDGAGKLLDGGIKTGCRQSKVNPGSPISDFILRQRGTLTKAGSCWILPDIEKVDLNNISPASSN